MTEEIKTKGQLHIQLFDEHGVLVQEQTVPNTITTLGKEFIADQLSDNPQYAPMMAMAIGTGTPSATALGTEVGRKGFRSNSNTGAVITYVSEYNIDDGIAATITEAGIFNIGVPATGLMMCSSSFAGIVKTLNGTLVITWTITVL